ncbi:MAG TPA: Shedu anti-phage system protein SduA domain-containing protein, partial [Rhodanobacteraceae bacterium]|nr:Shedu anti-phage system protein SduA domain-containing protein [Rhodanobacteraceae bacterium]
MAMQREYISVEDFASYLEKQKGERGISELLRTHPQLLYWTFCRASGHDRYVLREFPLGSRFVTDYVILNSYSGVWEVMFFELEPVECRPFTKAGVPSKRLAAAIKQIDDWSEYFSSHKGLIRED